MESCGMSVIKYIIFLFNLIFAISGIGIIVAGVIVITDINEYSHFLEGRILAPPIVLIVTGAIIFLIAFLGCYGAITENYKMLMAFAIALLVIFIIEMAVGIAAAVFKNDFAEVMKNSMKQSMMNNTDENMVAWDNVQMKLECCGVDAPGDWNQLAKTKFFNDPRLPMSCCKRGKTEVEQNGQCSSYEQDSYKQGCFDSLKAKVQEGASVLIGVGIGIAFVEVAGIILACCLAVTIKRDNVEK